MNEGIRTKDPVATISLKIEAAHAVIASQPEKVAAVIEDTAVRPPHPALPDRIDIDNISVILDAWIKTKR